MQREAPACQLRTLFERNEVFRQVYTVTSGGAHPVALEERVHAVLVAGEGAARFVVTNRDGRQVGVIGGESGRVLAETMRQHRLAVVPMTVTALMPVSADAQVRVTLE
jgi:hypothetical protein